MKIKTLRVWGLNKKSYRDARGAGKGAKGGKRSGSTYVLFFFFLPVCLVGAPFLQMCGWETQPWTGHLTWRLLAWHERLMAVLLVLDVDVVETCASGYLAGRIWIPSARIYEPIKLWLTHSCGQYHSTIIPTTKHETHGKTRNKREEKQKIDKNNASSQCWFFHPFGGGLRLRCVVLYWIKII